MLAFVALAVDGAFTFPVDGGVAFLGVLFLVLVGGVAWLATARAAEARRHEARMLAEILSHVRRLDQGVDRNVAR